jgi:hypothetical protein
MPLLSITLNDIQSEVTRFLSLGRNYDLLTNIQKDDVDSIIDRGLRQFYFPPPVPGILSHQWSFLRPTRSFTTVAEQESYALPDDFGAMTGSRITYLEQSHVDGPLLVSDYEYRSLVERMSVRVGEPRYATVRPRTTNDTLNVPVRHDLHLFPAPQKAVQMQYQYHVLNPVPSGLSSPTGADMHGETIMCSCLAIAEEYVVSPSTQYRALFRERLASSVALDRSTRGGGIIGKMRPTGDEAPPAMSRVTQVNYIGA